MEKSDETERPVGGDERVVVDGDSTSHVLGDSTTVVNGSSTVEAAEIVLRAGHRFAIEVGPHRLLIDESGLTISLDGGTITLTGADRLELGAGHVDLTAGSGIDANAPVLNLSGSASAVLRADGVITIQGALVKIN